MSARRVSLRRGMVAVIAMLATALEQKNHAVIEGLKRMIVSIDATLDGDQRSHLLRRLDGYIDQVEILEKQP